MSVAVKRICISAFVLLLVTISGINGEDKTTTTTAQPEQALNCSSIPLNEDLNYTWLNGTWFELYRKETSDFNQNWQCVKLVLTPHNSSMTLQTTYSQTSNLSHNTTITTNMTWDPKNPGMFNLTYNSSSLPTITLKVIKSDYTNYMMACGYTNVNNSAGAYFFYRKPTLAKVDEIIIEEAGEEYSDFNHLTPIIQNYSCSGSAMIYPAFTIIFTSIFTIFKIFS